MRGWWERGDEGIDDRSWGLVIPTGGAVLRDVCCVHQVSVPQSLLDDSEAAGNVEDDCRCVELRGEET